MMSSGPGRVAQVLRVLFVFQALMGAVVAPVGAELAPGQVVIVANAGNPESITVAEHYAARRGVPAKQIAKLDLPFEETMSREEYERELVVPLREFLQKGRIQQSIRVLVTVYGVPLRVSAPSLTEEEKRWRLDARDRLASARAVLMEVDRRAREIARSPHAERRTSDGNEPGLREFKRNLAFLEGIDRLAQETMARVKQLSPQVREQWYGRVEAWVRLYQGAAGVAQLYRDLPRQAETAEASALVKLNALYAEGMRLLLGEQELPVRRERDALYRQVEQVYGVYGVFALASLELSRLSTEQADASVDSELSLLWWDRHQYEADWRQANALYHGYRKPPFAGRRDIPVLMVSRLDAPTAELAARLVDRAMEAEQKGLTGTIYLDARGLPVKDKTDAYGWYDQSLRDLHGFLLQHTAYRPVLEDTESRFQRPGEAPDVAFYAGWYRLRHYEDAFTFRPGAIGYHLASAEAVSVHRSSESGWCKNALERGITATIGSVGEPYLDAFPEPLEFAALLSTGQYTLVEAYYLTARWVSWRMVLFGDPLYSPWKNKPAAPRSALSMFPLAPVPPSDRTFNDPFTAREEQRLLRDQARVKLDLILRR